MKNTYKILLMDLDNTILNFTETERQALVNTFRGYGIELTDEDVRCYNRINNRYWKMLERKKIDKEELKRLRFTEFVETLAQKPERDVIDINKDYMEELASLTIVLPGAEEAVRALATRYRLAIITNGTTWVQKRRFAGMCFGNCFEAMFISDDLGAQKPAPLFFDKVKEQIGEADVTQYLVVGDSISSDILGGTWAGMDTCLVSETDVEDSFATYCVRNLFELAGKMLAKTSKAR